MSTPTQPSAQSDAARLGAGSGLILVGMGAGRGVKLLTRVLIARFLGAAALGLYDLALTLVLVLAHVARGGIQVGMVRFGTPLWVRGERSAVWRLGRRAMLVPLMAGSAGATALFAAAPWLAEDVFHKPDLVPALRIIAPLVPMTAGLAVVAGAIQATQRMTFVVLIRDLIEPVSHVFFFLVLWSLGYGLMAALWGALVGGVIAFLVGLVVISRLTAPHHGIKTPTSKIREESLRQLLLFSLPVAASGMLAAYLLWADRLLVGYFLPSSAVGIYAAASQFGVLFALLLYGFSTMFSPMFADLQETGEIERMRELFRVSTKWGLYLLLPLLVVLAIRPEVALGGLFGGEFVRGGRTLQILLIGQFINILSGQVGMVLILSGLQRLWMTLNAVVLTVNVGLDVIWIPRHGLEGAAAASSLALVLLFGSGLIVAHRRLGLFPLDRRFWKLLPPTVAVILAVGALSLMVEPAPTLLGLAVALATAYGVGALVRLALPIDKEDRELLAALRARRRAAR